MSDKLISEISSLKIIYKEIIEGGSYFEEQDIYVKHLTELENIQVSSKKEYFFLKYKRQGLLSSDERLEQLYLNEEWNKDKEEEIVQYQYIITDNERNLKNIIPQQQGPILKVIQDTKKKLVSLLEEKQILIGATANDFAERDSFSYFIYLSLYKDNMFKEKYFKAFSDLEELEPESIKPYIELIEKTFGRFTEDNIKKISVLPFFINTFGYVKDGIHNFLGKPIVELTPFQTILFSLGSRNLNVLNHAEGQPPDLIGETKIDDIVLWYDQNYSIQLGKRNVGK